MNTPSPVRLLISRRAYEEIAEALRASTRFEREAVDGALDLAGFQISLRLEDDEEARAREFPLWCLDSNDKEDEHRYRGPFGNQLEGAAHARMLARDPDEAPRAFVLRRCRALRPSEVDGADWILDQISERLEESASEGGVPTEAWADWDSNLIKCPDEPTAEESLRAWLDTHFRTRIYVAAPGAGAVPEADPLQEYLELLGALVQAQCHDVLHEEDRTQIRARLSALWSELHPADQAMVRELVTVDDQEEG